MHTARWMIWIAVVVLLGGGAAALHADGPQTGNRSKAASSTPRAPRCRA